jgi:predicted small lipoprotein YifL
MIPPHSRGAADRSGIGAMAVAMALALALALTACGRVGGLEQPAPMYGAKAKADYAARKAAAAAAAKAEKDDGEPEPLAPDTPGPNDPDSRLGTLRSQPAPGMRALPSAAPPPGVLPDPFNHPQ